MHAKFLLWLRRDRTNGFNIYRYLRRIFEKSKNYYQTLSSLEHHSLCINLTDTVSFADEQLSSSWRHFHDYQPFKNYEKVKKKLSILNKLVLSRSRNIFRNCDDVNNKRMSKMWWHEKSEKAENKNAQKILQ